MFACTQLQQDLLVAAAAQSIREWTERELEPEKTVAVILDCVGEAPSDGLTVQQTESAVQIVSRTYYFLPASERELRAREAVTAVSAAMKGAA